MTTQEAKYEAYKIASVVLRVMASHEPPVVPNSQDAKAVAKAIMELSDLLALRLPSLRLEAAPEKCVGCEQCAKHCSMSLDVSKMVKTGKMENDECVLCGVCVDGCKQGAIRFTFRTAR